MQGLPAWARDAVERLGVYGEGLQDALQERVVERVLELGADASYGVRLSAMRLEVAWALSAASEQLGEARAAAERQLAVKKAALMLGDGFSGLKAQAIAEADAGVLEEVRSKQVAECRVHALRELLDAVRAVSRRRSVALDAEVLA